MHAIFNISVGIDGEGEGETHRLSPVGQFAVGIKMMNCKHHMSVTGLTITRRKGRINVVESSGRITLNYELNLKNLSCPCPFRGPGVCKHIQFYFSTVGAEAKYLGLASVPPVRNWLSSQDRSKSATFGADYNTFCYNFLHTDECTICLTPYVKEYDRWTLSNDLSSPAGHVTKLSQCPSACGVLFHEACLSRWKASGKACPLCYQKKDLPA